MISQDFSGFPRISKNFQGFPRISKDFQGFLIISQDFTWFFKISLSFHEFSMRSNVSRMFWLICNFTRDFLIFNPNLIKFYFMKPLKLSWAMTIFQELNKIHQKAPYRASCCRDDGCFCVMNWLLSDDDVPLNVFLNKQTKVNKNNQH